LELNLYEFLVLVLVHYVHPFDLKTISKNYR
jgi:hypothetical protein